MVVGVFFKKYSPPSSNRLPHLQWEVYDGLVARFDKAKARHAKVIELIAERTARRHQIETYLQELRDQEPLTEFWDADWLAMVDYITAYSKDDIRTTFKDGTEIKE